jgi:cytochrome c
MKRGWAPIFALAAVTMVSPARAEGDAAHGKSVFVQCSACHSLQEGQNGVGPSLHGLLGRKAASLPDFRYSPSMQRSGLTWDEATLKKYLPDPQATVPGTKMMFIGVKDPQHLDDLIAYLKEATK